VPNSKDEDARVIGNYWLNAFVQERTFSQIKDGLANTVLGSESNSAGPWVYGPASTGLTFSSSPHRNGLNVLFCDARVKFLPEPLVSLDDRIRLMQPSDGEALSGRW
jgi:prepilin-type processing-associated H-X9-DG protein